MKLHRLGIVVLSLVLVACGTAEQSSETTAATTTVSTLPVDCSKPAIEAAVGESISNFNCAGEWTAIQPDSYVGDCLDCESVWIYKWQDAKWNLMGRCNQYVPLVKSEMPCSPMAGWLNDGDYIDTMADFPEADIACELWVANRWPENVAVTGCTPEPIQ